MISLIVEGGNDDDKDHRIEEVLCCDCWCWLSWLRNQSHTKGNSCLDFVGCVRKRSMCPQNHRSKYNKRNSNIDERGRKADEARTLLPHLPPRCVML